MLEFLPMDARVDHLIDQALALPTEKRSALVVALLDSIEGSEDSSIAEAWRAEVGQRRAELRAGLVQSQNRPIPWAEARERLSAL